MPKYYNTKAEFIPQYPGMSGVYEQIEKAGRVCYRSEGKTEYDENGRSITALDFANKLLNAYKHLSVAEHGTIYLTIKSEGGEWSNFQLSIIEFYEKNPYSRVNIESDSISCYAYITTNYRVIIENDRKLDLQYMVDPTPYHIPRYTMHFFTDRGVSAESNRHRVNSPSERSTRYVNYGHDEAVSISIPSDFTEDQINERELVWENAGIEDSAFINMCNDVVVEYDETCWDVLDYWLFAILATEFSYMNLLRLGWKPQQARRVLTMSTQTELYVTAFEDDWVKYIGQRYFGTTGTPHPDMKVLAGEMIKEFDRIESIKKKIELLYK